MSERDTAVLVGVLGVFVAWMGGSSELFRFTRPGMRPYVLLAAAALILTSVISLVLQWRGRSGAAAADHAGDDAHDDETHDHGEGRPRIVALIALPVVVGLLLTPGALGSWAAGRDRGLAVSASFHFDAAKFLRQHAHDHTPPRMRIADFSSAAADAHDRTLLSGTSVRLVGFVAHYHGAATVNRFFIACCVADAGLVSAQLEGDDAGLPNDSWIDVVVRLDPVHSPSASAVASGAVASVHVLSLRRIGPPAKPYEYLYG